MWRNRHLEPACTLADVAAELGVSVERARQIEAAALAKLHRICERNGLTFPDMAPAERERVTDLEPD